MSLKGDCWDNTVLEAFLASLEKELVYLEDFLTRRQATQEIFWYIEGFYNTIRRHSFLGLVSPTEFEKRALAT